MAEEIARPNAAPHDSTPAATAGSQAVSLPRADDGFLPPPDFFGASLRAFLEEKRRDGQQVTIEVGKDSFTGRIFKLSLEEGWIALEHIDGRRRAFIIMEGGKIKTHDGQEMPLPSAAHK